MTDRWDKADIVAKIALGVAGFVLSGVLAWGEFSDRARARTERNAATEREILEKHESKRLGREASLKEEFRAYYEYARNAQDVETAKSDLDIASALAQTLGAPPFDQKIYSDAVISLRVKLSPPTSQTNAQAAVQSESVTTSTTVKTTPGDWFAVVGSFPTTGQGLAEARALAQRTQSLGCAEIWRTKISNNYAVVLGGKTTRGQALSAAALARSSSLASDAFTQVNREWQRQEGC